jgi:hypothetical protein
MTPHQRGIGVIPVALGVVAVIVVAAAGVLFFTDQSTNLTTTSTNSSPSTVCEVQVEGAGVFLQVISDSTQQPLPGITVHVNPTATSCYGIVKPSVADYTTNATGWIAIDVSNTPANVYFQASLVYAGRTYSFNLPQGPLDTTNATLRLPSGNLSISLCNTMATSNPCSPYTTSTTSPQGAYTTTTTSAST